VGKQARRKGLDTLVQAWALLPAHVRRQLAVQVVSAMVDGEVSLPPEWARARYVPDVCAVMENAHVLVFPTKQEAFGLVLVEAMAAGCMIVTTKAQLQRSIVGDEAGCFIDPHSSEELATALESVVADRSRLAVGMKAARRRFLSEYHHGEVGRRYAMVLAMAAGRTLPARPRVSP
jgi:glycosyltransferase involved in cell wall biosynthesis